MISRLYQLAEWNRLQQNFPYSDPDHEMYVAVVVVVDETTSNEESLVVGFCDVDARPCRTTPLLPRPYLSDVAVSPKYRRRGIARTLIAKSEDFLRQRQTRLQQQQQQQQQHEPLYIYLRVQAINDAAVAMYHRLDYDLIETEPIDICNPKKGNPVHVFRKRLDE